MTPTRFGRGAAQYVPSAPWCDPDLLLTVRAPREPTAARDSGMRSDDEISAEFDALNRIMADCMRRMGPWAHSRLSPDALQPLDSVSKAAGIAVIALYWAACDGGSHDSRPSRVLTKVMELHGR